MSATYYHNPRCSKSRQGLAILEEANVDFKIKEYLKEPMSKNEIKTLFKKLGKEPLEVVRTKEGIFKELDLKNKELNKEQWAETIAENPVLLERPILVVGDKAVIGRPPEDLNTIL